MVIFGKRIPMIFALVVWLILWEVIGRLEVVFLIPPLVDVVKALINLFVTQKFYEALSISVQAFATGLGLAVVIGIPLGILMGRVKFVDELLGMWVNIFVSAPLTAIVPALMVIVGFGQATVVVTVVLFSVWIIALDTRAGVKNINPSLLEMTRSFGARRIQVYTKVMFWAALPEILAGLRLGMIRGVRGVVVGQLLIAIMGIGELFELYSRNFLMDRFWALVIFIFLFAYIVSELVNRLEQRVEFYAGTR
ncbi:MAG: ABC transporter permease subunit [Spirochaetaceae bacterium]|nr:MAG: ABC transporter permease subunit [Spirochaetaceae bacterium]